MSYTREIVFVDLAYPVQIKGWKLCSRQGSHSIQDQVARKTVLKKSTGIICAEIFRVY